MLRARYSPAVSRGCSLVICWVSSALSWHSTSSDYILVNTMRLESLSYRQCSITCNSRYSPAVSRGCSLVICWVSSALSWHSTSSDYILVNNMRLAILSYRPCSLNCSSRCSRAADRGCFPGFCWASSALS